MSHEWRKLFQHSHNNRSNIDHLGPLWEPGTVHRPYAFRHSYGGGVTVLLPRGKLASHHPR